ncbi:Protein of unknown function DUF3223 [Macleaya cordata]|uniref:Uncharacterized protein n=1 Tax=Macleaya cordata TaxID=56857 RepID=A0A200QZ00_MACCD|nr:Protein of unknown function DUF3223 [Macleaya cordata]
MVSISTNSPPPLLFPSNPNPTSPPTSVLYFPPYRTASLLQLRLRPLLRTGYVGGRIGCQDAYGPDLLRKPVISPVEEGDRVIKKKGSYQQSSDEDEEDEKREEEEEDEWVDWEDQILEDTVPLVGFVRMILHSGKYQSGDRLTPEHEKIILERLLPYHPEYEKKIGSGVDYIKIGYHPDFDNSRCMFIVRKDGVSVDFSYWKCIKGLIRKNYPLYADSFILRHFRQRRRSE